MHFSTNFTNLQSSLIILTLFFIGQYLLLFHFIDVREVVKKNTKITELLNKVKMQQQIIQKENSDFSWNIPKLVNVSIDEKLSDRCETIDVSIVCAGYKSSRALVTLIKSIVFYRRWNRLHLHLIVDDVSYRILEHLFETWRIPAFEVSFYSTNRLVRQVDWIPTTHYSGIYGLMKLPLAMVLPRNLTNVIVLDTDLTFNYDIGELWRAFKKFGPQHIIGLVENQSNWYLHKTSHRWPALGRGFNTGVMLIDLNKLRSFNWNDYWTRIAIKKLKHLNTTQLADQDIINAVIKAAPEMVYGLPCEWNIQLSYFTQSEKCYEEGIEPKLIHWNSFRKENVPNKHGEFFQKLYRTFVEYDGNLLRKEILSCMPSNLVSKSAFSSFDGEDCKDARLAGKISYRTHIYFMVFNESDKYNGVDVTLATQLSLDRILMLEQLASQWTGPMSVAVFASDTETQSLIDFVSSSGVLGQRRNIAYHIVYKESSVNFQVYYPINYLRNVAMDRVTTPFVMHVDVDFVTKMKLREYLIGAIQSLKLTTDSKVALVIPPFETKKQHFAIPFLKKHIVIQLEKNIVTPFRFNMWKHGQYPVNYDKWKNASRPYKIDWMPYFEPYVVVSRTSPRFDQRFVGFGWNKAAYAMTLHAHRYEFIVLPGACIVHLPHSSSISNNKFRLNSKYRKCMHLLRKEFIGELHSQYNGTLSRQMNVPQMPYF